MNSFLLLTPHSGGSVTGDDIKVPNMQDIVRKLLNALYISIMTRVVSDTVISYYGDLLVLSFVSYSPFLSIYAG